MSVFAVEYVYAADSEAVRDEHRPTHRAFLLGLTAESSDVVMIAAGPYTDGSGALMMFSAPEESVLAATLKNDPFAVQGTISALRITAWAPVTGELKHHA